MRHFDVMIVDDPAADPLSVEDQARILDWFTDVMDKQRERRSVGRPDRGYISVGRVRPSDVQEAVEVEAEERARGGLEGWV